MTFYVWKVHLHSFQTTTFLKAIKNITDIYRSRLDGKATALDVHKMQRIQNAILDNCCAPVQF